MAQTADITTLIRNDRTQPDSAAVAHVVVGAGFLALGAAAAGIALLSMLFPSFIPLGYGIWRPIAMLALLTGFGTVSLVGGCYYVLPRLTATRLWNEPLAWVGLAIISGVTLTGMVIVGIGLGDGMEPFSMPWWLDLPLMVGLSIPPTVALQTLRRRSEIRAFVSVPFVLVGLGSLPLAFAAGNIPGLGSGPSTLGSAFTSAAYPLLLVFLGVGLVHYSLIKQLDRPLPGRQLAQVAFWSLLFSLGWFGIAQLVGGPIPTWLGLIAAVLGLGFPVGMLAASASLTGVIDRGWRGVDDGVDPVVLATVGGIVFGLIVATVAAMGGFRSIATLIALTPFWEGVTYGLVLGVLPLLVAGWSYHSLPRMTGRAVFTPELARRQVRLTLYGAGGLFASLVLAGIVAGHSWAGGSFLGGFSAVGEGWDAAFGPARLFVGIGLAFGIVAVFGNLGLASVIARTITRGPATTQEVLVIGDSDE